MATTTLAAMVKGNKGAVLPTGHSLTKGDGNATGATTGLRICQASVVLLTANEGVKKPLTDAELQEVFLHEFPVRTPQAISAYRVYYNAGKATKNGYAVAAVAAKGQPAKAGKTLPRSTSYGPQTAASKALVKTPTPRSKGATPAAGKAAKASKAKAPSKAKPRRKAKAKAKAS